MTLSDVFLGLGQERLEACLRQISLGKLKTYQLFERFKVRARLTKLNQDSLRKAAPKFLERLREQDEEFAVELAQAMLVSHLDMIIAVLNFLGVPHNEGFFEKDAELAKHLTEGWQQRAHGEFQEKYPEAVLTFYLNHLAHEVDAESALFVPAGAAA
ncbi:MAG: hypothetical protein J0L64_25385 [Acidobacteria bacterium]|nr:hypothetical protein [Acidobacteriota bacterium]